MTKDEAIAHAKAFADKQGWVWREPVDAETYRRWFIGSIRWRVVSNHGSLGGNARVEIEDSTGEIVKGNYIPR